MRGHRRGVREWSPGSLQSAVAQATTAAGLDDVAVKGAVSGLHRRGRLVEFELVELDGAGLPCAVIGVVLGADACDAALADGARARIWGRVEPDARYGRLRIRAVAADVDHRAPRTGGPSQARMCDDLVALSVQGRLSVARRPRLVGLVSASGGAGGEDVRALLSGVPGIALAEELVPMSGPAAPREIRGAVTRLARRGVDVILIARGGGSRSDLAAFDHPDTVQAIASCRTPVWTAIGHARDRARADDAANASFATPSAAALELAARAEGRTTAPTAAPRRRVARAGAMRALVVVAGIGALAVALAR